ncbi:hypothetical protein ACVGOW_12505 [Pseudonocardia saturnea]
MGASLDVPAARRAATVLAAGVTAVVALGADLVASRHPMHTVTLALVVGVVALTRVALVGRHRCLFAAVSGAVVAQPVLHAAMKVFPAAADGAPGAMHAVDEASITVLHVLLTTVVVVGVAGAEQLLLLAGLVQPFAAWFRPLDLASVRPPRSAPPRPPEGAPAPRWSCVANLPRRGPPATRASLVT